MSQEQNQPNPQQGKVSEDKSTNVSDDKSGSSIQPDAVMAKLAEIEGKIDSGKNVSAEDQKIIAALLAGDDGSVGDKGSDKSSKLSELSNEDIDNMSNSQLVDHIIKAVGNQFKDVR